MKDANQIFSVGEDLLTPELLVSLASKSSPKLELSKNTVDRVLKYRDIVDQALESGRVHYGINTGFGLLSDVVIEPSSARQLQINLVRSHACGVGSPVSSEMVRALLILKAHNLALGHSGISLDVLNQLLAFVREDILPMVPVKGSVGASGDLAPLSHLAMGLCGEGLVQVGQDFRSADEVLRERGIQPLSLKEKEGLSLINGTQFMSVMGAFSVIQAQHLSTASDICAATSLDAMRGTLVAFDRRIHEARQQEGQRVVAANIRALFTEDDAIMNSHVECGKVQDPYSFRCVPQVHGASRDLISYAKQVIQNELNSVSDNPLVFEDGSILSGGNFHGQPLAMALDCLGIAVAELGSISERRIEKLTNPTMSGLPPFLTKNSGLNSGMMIPHVVAASLVSENKVLSHPAVVDSIPTSADKEDHVSMGPIAGKKSLEINKNVSQVLAIEILSACQGIDLLNPLQPGRHIKAIYRAIRQMSPLMEEDRMLSQEIEDVASWILDGRMVEPLGESKLALQ